MKLKHIYNFFFYLGVFFIPFNSWDGNNFLGEFRREGAIFFFLTSMILLSIDSLFKKKIYLPKNKLITQLLIIFFTSILVSSIANFESIASNYLKKTSGAIRLIKQLISISLSFSIFILSFNVFKNNKTQNIFFRIRKIFSFSLTIVSVYAFFEILISKYNYSSLLNYLNLFNNLPFVKVVIHSGGRISSISQEPPFLAMYLITIAGWMFSYLITEKRSLKIIPSVLIIILVIFSGSRTALIVVTIQLAIFLWYCYRFNTESKKFTRNTVITCILLAIITTTINYKGVKSFVNKKINSVSFKSNIDSNISNKTRLGIQYTLLLIFKENPILGVGYGQQAYHAKTKYPEWATKDNYEFTLYYLNDNEKSFPPSYNMYVRILAELGIVGFCLLILLNLSILVQTKKLIDIKKNTDKVISISLLVSFIGYMINWLQFDSFRIFGFWICLGLLIKLTKNEQNDSLNTSL